MKFELKNKELDPAIALMMKFELNKADNRHRSKFINVLKDAMEHYLKDLNELKKKYNLLDENGMTLDVKKADTKDVLEYNLEAVEVLEAVVTIEGGLFAKNIEEIPRILEEYDIFLSDMLGVIYDKLIDQVEQQRNEEQQTEEVE